MVLHTHTHTHTRARARSSHSIQRRCPPYPKFTNTNTSGTALRATNQFRASRSYTIRFFEQQIARFGTSALAEYQHNIRKHGRDFAHQYLLERPDPVISPLTSPVLAAHNPDGRRALRPDTAYNPVSFPFGSSSKQLRRAKGAAPKPVRRSCLFVSPCLKVFEVIQSIWPMLGACNQLQARRRAARWLGRCWFEADFNPHYY